MAPQKNMGKTHISLLDMSDEDSSSSDDETFKQVSAKIALERKLEQEKQKKNNQTTVGSPTKSASNGKNKPFSPFLSKPIEILSPRKTVSPKKKSPKKQTLRQSKSPIKKKLGENNDPTQRKLDFPSAKKKSKKRALLSTTPVTSPAKNGIFTSYHHLRQSSPLPSKTSPNRETSRDSPISIRSESPKRATNATQSTSLQSTASSALENPPSPSSQVRVDPEASTEHSPQDLKVLKEYIESCWSCRASLVASLTDAEAFCMYETHIHPSLDVPVCVLCRDALEDIRNDEVCMACGNDDDENGPLLLCDGCSLACCEKCVTMANGGDDQARTLVRHLVDPNNNNSWHCPACQPPESLRSVQISKTATATAAITNPVVRTATTVLDELEALLVEQDKTGELLENTSHQRYLIFQEVMASVPPSVNANVNELQDEIESEFQLWLDETERHDLRLESTISSLHDELEEVYEMDLAKVYRDVLKRDAPKAAGGAEIPGHVRAANEELEKRERAQRPKAVRVNESMEDDYQDVEDLDYDSSDGDLAIRAKQKVTAARGRGFASSDSRLQVLPPDDVSEAERQEWQQERNSFLDHVKKVKGLEDATLRKLKICVQRKPEGVDKDEALVEQESEVIMVGAQRIRSGATASARRRVLAESASKQSSDAQIRTRKLFDSTPAKNDESESRTRNVVASASGQGNRDTDLVDSPLRFDDPHPVSTDESIFLESDLILCTKSANCVPKVLRTVQVASPLAKHLKPHQREGVQFIWNTVFADLAYIGDGVKSIDSLSEFTKRKEMDIGGCLLLHNMGLGKSLTSITILHTILTHPSLRNSRSNDVQLFPRTVLLVVPVNTLVNWEAEFEKWTAKLTPSLFVLSMNKVHKQSHDHHIAWWQKYGGVLLVSSGTLPRLTEDLSTRDLNPDILVMDEVHTMLSNPVNKVFKALNLIKTKRKIGLTGSPLQNQLSEYFHIFNCLRPGLFGFNTTAKFESEFQAPIDKGMRSDSTIDQRRASEAASTLFTTITDPFVNRRDATELMKELPPLQQVVIHTRQSRMQTKLYRAFEKTGEKNFFKTFSALRPIHNHPSCLLTTTAQGAAKKKNDALDELANPGWWEKVADPEKLKNVESGYKFILLLHILAYAEMLDEKVLVFTQCLRTLNCLENILQSSWNDLLPKFEVKYPGRLLGKWEKDKHYLRIDGSTSASDRGTRVTQFNETGGDSIRAFLISVKAGGIGINLPAASRVVLLDTHFNPTITNQAIYRTYRYGQNRPVFVYRFLTQGTMEEKVYSRSVNKMGVAIRVIDKKNIKRNFTETELSDLQTTLQWAQCENCEKWRMLLGGEKDDDLPEQWFCHMNDADPQNNSCDASEKSQLWYEKLISNRDPTRTSMGGTDIVPLEPSRTTRDKELEDNDEILRHLLTVTRVGKKKPLISHHYFHESLLKTQEVKTESGSAALSDDMPGSPNTTVRADVAGSPGSKKASPGSEAGLFPSRQDSTPVSAEDTRGSSSSPNVLHGCSKNDLSPSLKDGRPGSPSTTEDVSGIHIPKQLPTSHKNGLSPTRRGKRDRDYLTKSSVVGQGAPSKKARVDTSLTNQREQPPPIVAGRASNADLIDLCDSD